MRPSFYLFPVVLFMVSCGSKVDKKAVDDFKGYWEIAKVEFSDGRTKDFSVNETVDYIELHDGKGIRRKVMPQLDGKFVYASNPENMRVVDSAGSVYFQYKTDYREWKEEVLSVTDSTFAVRNSEGIEYHYKKFTPFNLK